ncbi:MAG TPA: Ig-like domain-containing protein [Candidatus Angelobacter sp.]|nr:Ig-like domain-containing protein [Candidatus Angelobacter sp.]
MFQNLGKYWLVLAAASCCLATAAFAGVTVSSPAPGATTGSPVQFVASASSGRPIMAMRIYVDDQSVFSNHSNNLNTSIPMADGAHHVVVQAWDSSGAVFKFPETITVNSSSAPPPPPPPPSGSGVSVTSPADGSTVGAPMHVVASANAGNPITAMRIYLDSTDMFTGNSNQLDTTVSASSGSHSLVVQAWDSTGAVYKQALTVNVSGGSGGGGGGGGPVPSGAIVQSNIQQMAGWENCTVCAGAGGNGTSASFGTQQGINSPSLSGAAMQFSIGGSTPYSDALWWKQLGGNNGITHFQYDVDFYLTNPGVAQALEFDVNQSNGVYKFIFGTQCDIKGAGAWDVWDTAGHGWVNTGVPCSAPSAYQWHHLTWELYRDDYQTHFVALTLDGVKNYVNMAFWVQPSGVSEINVAFQMDGDYVQHAYDAWLDNVTLSYW